MDIYGIQPRRKTATYEVSLGNVTLSFSYSTLVGVDGPLGRQYAENTWGPTTGRHLNDMGYRDGGAKEVTQHELKRFASDSLIAQVQQDVAWKLAA